MNYGYSGSTSVLVNHPATNTHQVICPCLWWKINFSGIEWSETVKQSCMGSRKEIEATNGKVHGWQVPYGGSQLPVEIRRVNHRIERSMVAVDLLIPPLNLHDSYTFCTCMTGWINYGRCCNYVWSKRIVQYQTGWRFWTFQPRSAWGTSQMLMEDFFCSTYSNYPQKSEWVISHWNSDWSFSSVF